MIMCMVWVVTYTLTWNVQIYWGNFMTGLDGDVEILLKFFASSDSKIFHEISV